MVMKQSVETMTVCDIPSAVNRSLSNVLTLKDIKSGFLVTGVWLCSTDIFTEEDFLPCAVTDRSVQGKKKNKKPLGNLEFSDSHASKLHLDISSQPSTSALNTGRSSSESSLHYASPAEIRPFQIAEASRENRRG
jgi:hypothetical protein